MICVCVTPWVIHPFQLHPPPFEMSFFLVDYLLAIKRGTGKYSIYRWISDETPLVHYIVGWVTMCIWRIEGKLREISLFGSHLFPINWGCLWSPEWTNRSVWVFRSLLYKVWWTFGSQVGPQHLLWNLVHSQAPKPPAGRTDMQSANLE
jgi:hypothetical protein